jgi:Transposase
MPMLADLVEVVIGVDTHKHTHTAAAVAAATGATLIQRTVPADAEGYQALWELANQYADRRVWALEATGGSGRWPVPGAARPPRMGHRAGPAQAAGSPARRQVGPAGRGPGRP